MDSLDTAYEALFRAFEAASSKDAGIRIGLGKVASVSPFTVNVGGTEAPALPFTQLDAGDICITIRTVTGAVLAFGKLAR